MEDKSVSTSEIYQAEIATSLQTSAIKHFMECPAANFVSKFSNPEHTTDKFPELPIRQQQESCVQALKMWLEREEYFKVIQNMHATQSDEYTAGILDIVNSQNNFGRAKETEFRNFMRDDILRHSQKTLAMILRKLLELWGLADDTTSAEDYQVEDFGAHEIQRCIAKMRERMATASQAQRSIAEHSAIQNYLSRITAVLTMQRGYNSEVTYSAIMRETKEKPRFMVHIGGVVLNLMNENIQKIGRNLDVIDLKGKYQEKIPGFALLDKPTSFMGTCVFGNKLYLSGGRNAFGQFLLGEDDSEGVKDLLFMVTLASQKLKSLQPMNIPRSHHGFVNFNGELWAVGGSNGNGPTASVSVYDVLQDEWRDGPDLPSAVSCASCVVHKDSIWLIGGRDSEGQILNSTFVYQNGYWQKRTFFPINVMLSSAAVVNGKLYLTGGVTGSMKSPKSSAGIYRYNDTLRKWELWTTMSDARMNHATAHYGNYLIVTGGHTMHNLVPKEVPGAYCYDTTSDDNVREKFTPSLGTNRIGVGAALLGDPNVLMDLKNKETHSMFSVDSGSISSRRDESEGYSSSLSFLRENPTHHQSSEQDTIKPALNLVQYLAGGRRY